MLVPVGLLWGARGWVEGTEKPTLVPVIHYSYACTMLTCTHDTYGLHTQHECLLAPHTQSRWSSGSGAASGCQL